MSGPFTGLLMAFLAGGWYTLADAEVQIDHKAVGCIVSGRHPTLDARLTPHDRVSRARLLFRAGNTPHWYYVDMAALPDFYRATLPRPRKGLPHVQYYLEAIDPGHRATRTEEYTAVVASGPAACRKDVQTASFVATAKVLVGVEAGAPALPPGFEAAGVVSVPATAAGGAAAASGAGAATGAAVAGTAVGAAGAAAASGGLSTTAVVVGVAAAGAAAGAVVVAGRGGDGDCTPGGGIEYSIATPLHGDLDCANFPQGPETNTIVNHSCSDVTLLSMTSTTVSICPGGGPPGNSSNPIPINSTLRAGQTRVDPGPVIPAPCQGTCPREPCPIQRRCTIELTRTLQTSAGPVSSMTTYTVDFSTCRFCN